MTGLVAADAMNAAEAVRRVVAVDSAATTSVVTNGAASARTGAEALGRGPLSGTAPAVVTGTARVGVRGLGGVTTGPGVPMTGVPRAVRKGGGMTVRGGRAGTTTGAAAVAGVPMGRTAGVGGTTGTGAASAAGVMTPAPDRRGVRGVTTGGMTGVTTAGRTGSR